MKRRRKQPDSFELLLDTMCNTFGGIIMIALLIALLSRDASSDAEVRQRTEAVQKQLEQAKMQIAEAERLQEQVRAQAADPGVTSAFALLTERDELRSAIDASRAMIESNATVVVTMPVAPDPAEVDRMLAERQRLTNEVRTLADAVEREGQARQRQFRLPRERATGKKTHYFIVRFGKIYPVHVMREAGRRELNDETLQWRGTPQGEIAVPRREVGINSVTGLGLFAGVFNQIPKQTYAIHFLVYPDSFPGFIAARQIPTQRGYDVGWEFLPEDRPVIFSSQGQAPPAL